MTVEAMQDRIIHQEGFESKKTIKFFKICESNDIEKIEKEFKKIIK